MRVHLSGGDEHSKDWSPYHGKRHVAEELQRLNPALELVRSGHLDYIVIPDNASAPNELALRTGAPVFHLSEFLEMLNESTGRRSRSVNRNRSASRSSSSWSAHTDSMQANDGGGRCGWQNPSPPNDASSDNAWSANTNSMSDEPSNKAKKETGISFSKEGVRIAKGAELTEENPKSKTFTIGTNGVRISRPSPAGSASRSSSRSKSVERAQSAERARSAERRSSSPHSTENDDKPKKNRSLLPFKITREGITLGANTDDMRTRLNDQLEQMANKTSKPTRTIRISSADGAIDITVPGSMTVDIQ